MCFEICSNGEGRVGYPTVLKVAQAARKLIQRNPSLAFENGNQQTRAYGCQAGGPGPSSSASTSSATSSDGGLPPNVAARPPHVSEASGYNMNINTGVYGMPEIYPASGSLSTSESGLREDEHGIPGVPTRNGGFEALAFPQGIIYVVIYIFIDSLVFIDILITYRYC